ncbi:hypothetical protein ACFLTH_07355 [Bacteroidota bacterium]
MDTVAHAVWSFIIFRNFDLAWLAVFFGAMPDLFSWTIYTLYGLIFKRKELARNFRKPNLNVIPKWVFTLYGITHSLFVFAGIFLLTWLVIGTLPTILLAWLIHILIDIPTHTKDFLPTPFLWPIKTEKYAFNGISWGSKWFMLTNWSAIIITLIIVFS